MASGLLAPGVPTVCIDAPYAQPLLATMTNKADCNDARALADLARVKLFREVYVEPLPSVSLALPKIKAPAQTRGVEERA